MYQKACRFHDEEIANDILHTDNVAEIKKLGRKVHAYDENVWNGVRQIIVYEGLKAKFSQNTDLKRQLVDTGDAVLKDLQDLVKDGSTVTIGTKTYTAMTDKDGGADGIDDNDSTVITDGKAYQLQTAEIVKASSIGADTAATNATNANDAYDTATTTFTLNKGRWLKLQPPRRSRC